MPPLRQRAEDLPLLIDDLIRSQAKAGHGSVRLAPDAINVLRHYPWPGNVRELSNLIERLAVLHPSPPVDAAQLTRRYSSDLPATAAVDGKSIVEGARVSVGMALGGG